MPSIYSFIFVPSLVCFTLLIQLNYPDVWLSIGRVFKLISPPHPARVHTLWVMCSSTKAAIGPRHPHGAMTSVSCLANKQSKTNSVDGFNIWAPDFHGIQLVLSGNRLHKYQHHLVNSFHPTSGAFMVFSFKLLIISVGSWVRTLPTGTHEFGCQSL